MTLIGIYGLELQVKVIVLCILAIKLTKSGRDDDLFCSCYQKEIKCKGIQTLDTLKIHFAVAAQNCDVSKLKISNSLLLALPNDLLNGTEITEIKIERTYLPFLAIPVGEGKPFINGNSIVKFSVETVQHPYNWKWQVLNVCENLKKLYISKSEMIYIGPAFKKLRLPHLERLTIENSGVRWIHDKAFVHLQNLAIFNLRNNHIKCFKRSLLPVPSYLTVFNFRSNELEYLEDDFFKDMPLLTYVNLEKNNLMTLSDFENRAFFINLSGNPLRCDCSIEWLNKVKNQTDSYRLQCLDPDFNHTSIKVKDVDWDKKDC